ncbi:alpha/beta fold hydrolase [Streptomyces sp. SL13]|uniref:Alpha/beta fold hydrolase n=1 Tax=Streptantibioticus silvisoli TaxID=2705255 RepID=A0AA90KF92_9ACTN|nr:alpha/beta fold hydrolase [Streptantibioticus silvisoli]MDI5968654.1 alpha/beta fold hydrolase [Streptantibioticus silvisoli]
MHLARIRPWRTRGRAARRRIVAGAVAVAALLGAGAASVAVAVGDAPAAVHRTNAFMTMPETPGSKQTVRIDTSFFTPAGGGRHPAILLAHGFGGSKDDMTGQATTLARDGYAVLTWSARGFGRSTGAIGLDAPDREVADVERLVDWLGHRSDVVQDGPDDPRVGVTGASYGGAISLLAAGYDKRIDAIAPQITWWNLPQALFPQNAQGEPADSGVFKKLWAGIFFTTGSTGTPSGSSPALPGTGGAPGGGTGGAGPASGTGSGSGSSGTASGTGSGTASGAGSNGPRAASTGRAAGQTGGSGKTAGGQAAAAPAPGGCRFTAALCAVYRQAAVTGRADPAAIALLERSSPSSVGSRIKVPTLIVQGQNDSLFPLDQADAMARTIASNGAPVSVDWSSGGHDGGDQETARVDGRVQTWFDTYLKHEQVNTDPAFRVTRSGGVDTTTGEAVQRGATADRYPGLNGTSQVTVRLSGGPQTVRNPAGGSPPSVSGVPGLGALSQLSSLGQSLSLDFPGQFAVFDSAPLTKPLTVTGAPRVRVRVSSDAADGDAVLFAKVYDVGPDGSQTLPHQLVAPLRVTGAGSGGRTVTVTLPVVDHEFAAGHRMRLVLSATDLGYSSPSAPADYRVAAAGSALTVPTVPTLRTAGATTAAWVWVLPLVALAVAAALLLTGRRRRTADAGGTTAPGPDAAGSGGTDSDGTDPGGADLTGAGPQGRRGRSPRERPAGDSPAADNPASGSPAGRNAPDETVPLEISGLSKRYRGSQDRYAVRELSFRVERGQVLGLLGPNGAGKTTTMRMLMGLITPDAGGITVFGQPISAGAPVLSRVGAFVEGAGFLPHLTGRANLDLYWRATGRPAADAQVEQALEIADLGEALDRAVRTYSQGMRQRLAIAQAMLGLPDLLILDEPTNGLDPPQIREMRSVIGRYAAGGRTVIVSSHLLSEVEQSCTHLVVMDKGRLVAAGPVDEIIGGSDALFVGAPGATAPQLERVAAELAELPGVSGAEPAEDGLVVRLDGLGVPGLLAELLRLDVPVERVGRHQRLEDAFLTLIGGQA